MFYPIYQLTCQSVEISVNEHLFFRTKFYFSSSFCHFQTAVIECSFYSYYMLTHVDVFTDLKSNVIFALTEIFSEDFVKYNFIFLLLKLNSVYNCLAIFVYLL